jgi:hypothetical protein
MLPWRHGFHWLHAEWTLCWPEWWLWLPPHLHQPQFNLKQWAEFLHCNGSIELVCCGTDMPCHQDQSKSCAIENWCVCQWAFASYITKAGGCTAIQDIQCGTNKMQAMKLYKEYNRYCEALDSINVWCMNPKNVEWRNNIRMLRSGIVKVIV